LPSGEVKKAGSTFPFSRGGGSYSLQVCCGLVRTVAAPDLYLGGGISPLLFVPVSGVAVDNLFPIKCGCDNKKKTFWTRIGYGRRTGIKDVMPSFFFPITHFSRLLGCC